MRTVVLQQLTEWSAHLAERLSPIVADVEAALGADDRVSSSQADPAVAGKLVDAINQVSAQREDTCSSPGLRRCIGVPGEQGVT